MHIPRRHYYPPPSDSAFQALGSTERVIVACWFTRHHDGRIRERFLRALPAFDSAWSLGYVVLLCGEYVIEMICYIWEHRDLFDRLLLGRFLRDNEPFYARIRSMMISYWNCYHRSSFPSFDDYVGSHILKFFADCITEARPTGMA